MQIPFPSIYLTIESRRLHQTLFPKVTITNLTYFFNSRFYSDINKIYQFQIISAGDFSIIDVANNKLTQFNSNAFKTPLENMLEYNYDYVSIGGSMNKSNNS